MTRLILASSSPYRRELLQRLQLDFACISPDIDESCRENEPPAAYVQRLAHEKAAEISRHHPDAIVIGSDQCSVNHGNILGKPKDRDHAIEQLTAASGQSIEFLTGVSIQHHESGRQHEWMDTFTVTFRDLKRAEIERYLDAEQPYNCAGSFKSEQLGISLCQSMQGDDPSAFCASCPASLNRPRRKNAPACKI